MINNKPTEPRIMLVIKEDNFEIANPFKLF